MSEGGVDRFQLEERIATGGTAQVYRARDTATGDVVAVKIVDSTVATDHARFARETSVVARLDHPNIVRYIAHGLTPRGELFLAMDLVAGLTLRERLHRDAIGIRDTVHLGIHLADALVHVHQAALVHRDIKPSNILGIGEDFRRAKLADFGIVLPIGSLQRITRAGSVVGTLRYMSPEQVNGHPIDYRSDLYSLGCVLFECILRRPAHPEPTPSRVRQSIIYEQPPNIASLTENVPSELAALIAQLLHKHPYRRPDTAAEVRDRLAAMTHVPNEPARLGHVGFSQDLNGSFVKLLGTPVSTRDRRPESSQPLDDTRSWLSPFERRVTYCMIAQSPTFSSTAASSTAASSTAGVLSDEGQACLELLTKGGLQALAFVDGYMTAVSRLRSSPADETEMLASAALSLRAVHPGVSIAIIAGAGLLQDGIPATAALEGARRLLETTGRPGAIYLDIEAAQLLEDRFAIDGETMPLVLGERRVGKLTPRAGPRAPFVGRTRELGRLIGLVETAAATRRFQSIVVSGDIGLGKTRLLCELDDALESDATVAVFMGRSHPPCIEAPLLALADLSMRTLADEGPNPMRRDSSLVDVLQPWIHTTLSRAGVAPERDAAIAQLASNMLFDWLLAQSRRQPTVLLFDDAQWMAATTFDWLRRLARTAARLPLVIARFASHELEPLAEPEATLGLCPLDIEAARALVRGLCGPDTPDDVAERVAGNPFFAGQLATYGVDQLPAAVIGVVQASLDRASAEARRILRAAAVVGLSFDRAAIEPLVSDLDQRDIDLRLRELTELGVISVDGGGFWFDNAIVHAAASAMLIEADRQLCERFRSPS